MPIVTTTNTMLLERLLDPSEDDVWRELDDRYRPIVFGLARRLGLGEEEAADAAQETLARFFPAYRAGQYDRTRGKLRSWLIGIAKHVLADMIAARGKQRNWRGESIIQVLEDDASVTAMWQTERRSTILARAMKQLRETTRTSEQSIQVFEMIAFHQRSPESVAVELGMTRHDVYVAKHRITERLREIVTSIETKYDGEE